MKSYRFSLILAAGVLAVFGIGAAHTQAQVLLNGGFESPAVTTLTTGGGTNWTSTGDAFIVPNSAGYGLTPYGTQYLGLNGTSATPGSDSQTMAGFVAGTTYVLGVDFADLLGGTPTELRISVSGVLNLSQTYTAPTGGPYGSTATIPFTSAVFFFTPLTSGAETIAISNLGQGAIAVDNVALYGGVTPPVVPEPASITAALLGVGAVVGAVRRRSRRA